MTSLIDICLVQFVYLVNYLSVTLGLYLFAYLFIYLFILLLFSATVDVLMMPVRGCN